MNGFSVLKNARDILICERERIFCRCWKQRTDFCAAKQFMRHFFTRHRHLHEFVRPTRVPTEDGFRKRLVPLYM